MTRTDKLNLPLIEANQSQKHVTHNEAVLGLDALLHIYFVGRNENTPPLSPNVGNAWVVGGSPTDAWRHQAGKIAFFDSFGWHFYQPVDGMSAWDGAADELVIYADGAWRRLEQEPSALHNLEFAGIGTMADATNRLAVKADGVLFCHPDHGQDVRVKLNKLASSDTASVLFQNGWSGRAELGLTGSDDLTFKVSANGVDWKSSLVCDSATGAIAFPNGLGADTPGLLNKLNLLKNAGRMAREQATLVRSFDFPDQLAPESSARIEGYARYINNSIDYGGTGAPNDEHVKALVDKIRSPVAAKNLPEFWVAKITSIPRRPGFMAWSIMPDYRILGVDMITGCSASLSCYLKVMSGTVAVSSEQHDVWIDGSKITGSCELTTTDNWRHLNVVTRVAKKMSSNRFPDLLPVSANNFSELLLALPAILPDRVRVAVDEGMIASAV